MIVETFDYYARLEAWVTQRHGPAWNVQGQTAKGKLIESELISVEPKLKGSFLITPASLKKYASLHPGRIPADSERRHISGD